MKRSVSPLLVTSVVTLALVGAVALPASAATLPAGDSLYALSCPQDGDVIPVPSLQLWAVDAATAAGTDIGSGTGDFGMVCAGQPAWDPVHHIAYAIALTGEHEKPSLLVHVDLTTGASTPVAEMFDGDDPAPVTSLAIGLDGAAYALSYNQLYSVNLTTGALSAIGGELPVPAYGFAVDPVTGSFYALGSGGELLSIDVSTGAFAFVGELEIPGTYTMQIDSVGTIWFQSTNVDESRPRSNIYSVPLDLSTAPSLVGILSTPDAGQPFIEALLLVPAGSAGGGDASVPSLANSGSHVDPALATVAGLLVIAGAALLIVRRRRAGA